MAASRKLFTTMIILAGSLIFLQLACLNSAPIPTASAPVETILALTETPGIGFPTATIVPTITRTAAPLPTATYPGSDRQTPAILPSDSTLVTALSTPWLLPGTPLPAEAQALTAQNLPQIVELKRYGGGRIQEMRFSTDGKLLGVETSSGRLLYTASNLNEIPVENETWEASFGPAPGELQGVALSDGVYLELAQDGSLQAQLLDATAPPEAFSSNWQLAAGFLATDRIGVWDTQSGELERTLDTGSAEPGRQCADFSSLDLSPDGRFLAAGCRISGEIYIWRVQDAVLMSNLDSRQAQVGTVKFSRDSRLLGAVLPENVVILWRVRDGELLRRLDDAQGARLLANGSLAFSPDSYYLVGGFTDGELLVWRLSDGALLRVLQGPAYLTQQRGEGLALSPDGTRLIYSSGNQVLVRNYSDGNLLYTIQLPDAQGRRIDTGGGQAPGAGQVNGLVKSLSVSGDGRTLGVLFDENQLQLHLYRFADGVELDPLLVQDLPLLIRTAALDDVLAVITTQGVYFYQVSDRAQLGWLPPAQDFDLINFAALSPDGSKIALGREGRGVEVWDWQRSEKLLEFTAENVTAVSFSPGGTLFVISSREAIHFFQTSDWQTLGSLPVGAVFFSFLPDGSLLGASDDRRDILFVDTNSITTLDWRLILPSQVSSLIFAPKGKQVCIALEDGTLRIYGLPR